MYRLRVAFIDVTEMTVKMNSARMSVAGVVVAFSALAAFIASVALAGPFSLHKSLEIRGQADSVGGNENTIELSKRRAKAAHKTLQGRTI